MSIHRANTDAVVKIFHNALLPTIDTQISECADFEMRLADCLEAYGVHKGEVKCRDLIADLKECLYNGKARQRTYLMRKEHVRQFKAGERKECWSKTPEYDSY